MSGPQKAMVAVLVMAVMLFVAVLALPGRSGEGDVTAEPGGLPGLVGDWFGDQGAADPGDLSASCLQPEDRLVFAGSCTLRVAPSGTRLRTVRVRADHPVRVSSRAPESDFTISSDIDPGDDPELAVAVDGDGGDIDLVCRLGFGQTCAVTLVRREG